MSTYSSNMRGAPPTTHKHLLSKAASIDWTGPSNQRSHQWDSRQDLRGPTVSHASQADPWESREYIRGPGTCASRDNSQDRAAPVLGRGSLPKAEPMGKVDIRSVRRETEASLHWEHRTDRAGHLQERATGVSSMVLPPVLGRPRSDSITRKGTLRKTLSDNVTVSRRENLELTVEEFMSKDDLSVDLAPRGGSLYQSEYSGATGVSIQQSGGVSSSCPNLVQNATVAAKAKVRITRSSDGHESSNSAGSEHRVRQKLLTVPNIFVTSFTHTDNTPGGAGGRGARSSSGRSSKTHHQGSLNSASSDSDVEPMLPIGPKSHYRHSAPELSGTQLPSYWERLRDSLKSNLYKSLSDTNTLPSKPNFNNNNAPIGGFSNTISVGEKSDTGCRKFVNEPRIAKVLSYLYIGNLETSYDERLTCRLSIRSIIDLSNIVPEDVPPIKRSHAPCMCSHDERHLKATLRLGLAEIDIAEISQSFAKINKFIEGTRKADKKVLVVCWTGNSVSALAVMQYLMVHHGCNLRRAYSMVMRQGTDIDLSPVHQVLLQTLEKHLLPQEEQSLCFDQCWRQPTAEHLTREAWTSYKTNANA